MGRVLLGLAVVSAAALLHASAASASVVQKRGGGSLVWAAGGRPAPAKARHQVMEEGASGEDGYGVVAHGEAPASPPTPAVDAVLFETAEPTAAAEVADKSA